MTDEKLVAGAGYILTLFNDIEQLTSYFANYLNTFIELKHKYRDVKNLDQLEECDRSNLISLIQGMRSWVVRTYIKMKALEEQIGEVNTGRLEESYKEVVSSFVLNPNTVEKYVIEINRAFAKGILRDLLVQAHDLYTRLTSE